MTWSWSRSSRKYVQVRHGTDARSHNRGLGLTFVRLAARAHGGEASVTCPPEGGSVFRFEVPARAAAPKGQGGGVSIGTE
jgi:signal transduction histidine kinase